MFGMGTGVTLPIQSPENCFKYQIRNTENIIENLIFRISKDLSQLNTLLPLIKSDKPFIVYLSVHFMIVYALLFQKLLVNKFYGQALGQLVLVN